MGRIRMNLVPAPACVFVGRICATSDIQLKFGVRQDWNIGFRAPLRQEKALPAPEISVKYGVQYTLEVVVFDHAVLYIFFI